LAQADLILVGGFLGAGKTTFLGAVARRLTDAGKRVGIVTNDQAADLADTGILGASGFDVREVAGGCFCCRFDDLVTASDDLISTHEPDVILAEPVGSCTDLAATVLRPIQNLHGHRFRVAPLTVLADPTRLEQSLEETSAHFPAAVSYIYRLQLEEADIVVLNKADLLDAGQRRKLTDFLRDQAPGRPVLELSAKTGEGVDGWLARIGGEAAAGKRAVDVDYDEYADGEALLGWLNATVALEAKKRAGWADACLALLKAFQRGCALKGAEIAHVKLFLTVPGGSVSGNLTSTQGEPEIRGSAPASARNASLTLNARVRLDPQELKELVTQSLAAVATLGLRAEVERLEAFRPGRPEPTHRMPSPGA
jgi:G3E family GTPase